MRDDLPLTPPRKSTVYAPPCVCQLFLQQSVANAVNLDAGEVLLYSGHLVDTMATKAGRDPKVFGKPRENCAVCLMHRGTACACRGCDVQSVDIRAVWPCRRGCMCRQPIVLLHHVDLERLYRLPAPLYCVWAFPPVVAYYCRMVQGQTEAPEG